MGTVTLKTIDEPKTRVRFRFGIRGLSFFILLLALVLGWFHAVNQRLNEREVLLSQLLSERIFVNNSDPSYLTLFLMKVQSTDSSSIEQKYAKWISPGWFSSPRGFNAGRLPEGKVKPLVERLQLIGPVNEVLFQGGTLDGLRLFYIGEVPIQRLGPERAGCLIREHNTTGNAEFHAIPGGRSAPRGA